VRTNATVITPKKRETHIRDRGPRLNIETFQRFRTHFKKLFSEETNQTTTPTIDLHDIKPMVILSGSIPEGLPADSYGMLLHDAHEMGALTVLDASGEALRIGLEEKPYFIKPNRHETEEALGFLPQSEADYRKAIDLFHTAGIVLVMISRGKEGLYLSDGHTTMSASVRVEQAINTVGSGDAAVAGGVYSIIHKHGIEETARLSCALGAANTITAGACIFETDHVKKFYRNVVVKRL
jgi:tagatose 6-phosphate kinase